MKAIGAACGMRAAVSTLILVVLGCANALDKEKFPYSRIGEACAPWDGPAVELHFSTAPLECGHGDIIDLTISFWRDLPLHHDQTFSLDAQSRWGGASYCLGAHLPCERASSGNIHIDSFTPGKGALGTYDLVFPKLGHVRGSFHAAWCKMQGPCR